MDKTLIKSEVELRELLLKETVRLRESKNFGYLGDLWSNFNVDNNSFGEVLKAEDFVFEKNFIENQKFPFFIHYDYREPIVGNYASCHFTYLTDFGLTEKEISFINQFESLVACYEGGDANAICEIVGDLI
jgi:hypothetical protein